MTEGSTRRTRLRLCGVAPAGQLNVEARDGMMAAMWPGALSWCEES